MKSYSDLKGLGQLRTMHSTKQRSIPRAQRVSEIELYLLEKEKERFLKEVNRLRKRYDVIVDRVMSIQQEIDKQQVVLNEKRKQDRETIASLLPLGNQGGSNEEGSEQDWKTKKINY